MSTPEVKQRILEWAKSVTKEYPNVALTDYTTSWQNGIAFCSIVHHFQPELVDVDSLDPEDKIGNLDKAFQALKTMGVAPTLSAESVAREPDELAIRAYLIGVHSNLSRKLPLPRPSQGHRRRRSNVSNTPRTPRKEELVGDFSPDKIVQNVKPDFTYKVIILGDSAVGKSALFERWRSNLFQQTSTTVGMELWTKTYECDGKFIQIQLWDTAGQELYRAVTKSYYREAMGALLVFDITKADTFAHIASWYKEIQVINQTEKLPILVIGNKADMESERMVPLAEARQYTDSNGFQYIETSARQGNDCQRAFQLLFQEIHKMQSQNPAPEKVTGVQFQQFDPPQKSGCPCGS
jgi:small GTP-binding protein